MVWTDEQVDGAIGTLLRAGLALSVAAVLGGGVWYLAQAASIPDYHAFRGEPQTLRGVRDVFTLALHGNPAAAIQLGLLLLIATPILRVGFSVAAFALRKDKLYVAITLVVLAVLSLSLSGHLSH